MSAPHEIVRTSKVSLAGRVVVRSGPGREKRPFAGARVELIHPSVTAEIFKTAPDGSYFFAGLPPGSYMLQVSYPEGGRHFGVVQSPTERVRAGRPTWVPDLELSRSAVQGKVSIENAPGVLNAGLIRIGVLGSPRHAVTDSHGLYYLGGLRSSTKQKRSVQVVFRGLRATCRGRFLIRFPGDVTNFNMTLSLSRNHLEVKGTVVKGS